jgi:hypothetical protein
MIDQDLSAGDPPRGLAAWHERREAQSNGWQLPLAVGSGGGRRFGGGVSAPNCRKMGAGEAATCSWRRNFDQMRQKSRIPSLIRIAKQRCGYYVLVT